MTTKYYVNEQGVCLGGYDGAEPPAGAIEVPYAPNDGLDTWDFANSQWIPYVPPPPPRHITRLAFRNRFTQAEKVAVDLAGFDDPTAPLATRQQAATVRVAMEDTRVAVYIDLDRADTRAGVQVLEAAGILGTGRALEILDAEIQQYERPI